MTQAAKLTSVTSRHALPLLFAGQAQKEFTVNEALARLDLLVQPTCQGEISDPPADPAPGDCYLVGESATGEWQGHEECLAGWDGTQWTFVTPRAGMILRDLSSSSFARYEGGWQRLEGPADPDGGTNIDLEAREAISALISVLKSFGIFS